MNPRRLPGPDDHERQPTHRAQAVQQQAYNNPGSRPSARLYLLQGTNVSGTAQPHQPGHTTPHSGSVSIPPVHWTHTVRPGQPPPARFIQSKRPTVAMPPVRMPHVTRTAHHLRAGDQRHQPQASVTHAQHAAVIQRMFKPSNVEAQFQTEKGSTYEVSPGYLKREKYYGGTSENPKSIFYGTAQITEECQDARNDKNFKSYKVEAHGFGTVKITFLDKQGRVYYWAILQQYPALNLYPMDMILKDTGRGIGDDRFHIGDKISNL